jgi:hypothetical protein
MKKTLDTFLFEARNTLHSTHTLKDGRTLKVYHNGSGIFKAFVGNNLAGALMVDYPQKREDGSKFLQVFNTEVKEPFRRLGVATHMYDAAEAVHGPLEPSEAQSDDAFAFWSKRRPEAYGGPDKDLRFHPKAASLVGQTVHHPEYGSGKIGKVHSRGVHVEKPNGNTYWLRRNEIRHLL